MNNKFKKVSRTEQKLINSIANELKKLKEVQTIFLFGSYSRGQQKPISDIDICVITDKIISDEMKSMISSHSSRKIDVSLFWSLPPLVRYAVLREGKMLFNRNQAFIHETIVETMSEFLDFRHIIDRNIARVFA